MQDVIGKVIAVEELAVGIQECANLFAGIQVLIPRQHAVHQWVAAGNKKMDGVKNLPLA